MSDKNIISIIPIDTSSYNFLDVSNLPNNSNSSPRSVINALNNDIESVEFKDYSSLDNMDYSNITEDGFTVQGYTIIDGDGITSDGKVLITAYCDDVNSRVYIYNASTGEYEGKIILNNYDHVGGVTFDSINQILYVTGSQGKVNTYDYKELSLAIEEAKRYIPDDYTIDLNNDDTRGYVIENNISVRDLVSEGRFNSQNGMDSIYYYNGVLYSSTYSGDGDLVRTEINIERDRLGNIVSINESSSSIVAKIGGAVQGLYFYNQEGTDYLVTSSSAFGMSSKLTLFKINADGTLSKEGALKVEHKGLEGIHIDDYGNITGIFEYDDQSISNITTIDELKNSTVDDILDNALNFAGSFWDLMN